ncbi:hypothetical protein [Solirubrum puertoriconensis]|uniref:Uncharacterized protein n=1 Tax=Solirubrum puertoriconensis TaxID=1751427 RepID=A0A9X0HIZ8_SOLP1|nr:hypothetical protein [Solirubrum puertoriconensis]KUG06762.1 hypothetical protein ASU33_05370 [Solirubrum puertoriconensis]
MRIAFDLDNTLIRGVHAFPPEAPKRRMLAWLFGKEQLRQGIEELCAYCQQQGHEVWVYTTSYRSLAYIRRLFWLYGIQLNGVINQARHNREARVQCSKHPPSFGIDLLIDDASGVGIEGDRYGFRVIIIDPKDEQWTARVRSALQENLAK